MGGVDFLKIIFSYKGSYAVIVKSKAEFKNVK